MCVPLGPGLCVPLCPGVCVPLGLGVCTRPPRHPKTHTPLYTHPRTHKPPWTHTHTHTHGQEAGGTHPTGMLSCRSLIPIACLQCVTIVSFIFESNFRTMWPASHVRQVQPGRNFVCCWTLRWCYSGKITILLALLWKLSHPPGRHFPRADTPSHEQNDRRLWNHNFSATTLRTVIILIRINEHSTHTVYWKRTTQVFTYNFEMNCICV